MSSTGPDVVALQAIPRQDAVDLGERLELRHARWWPYLNSKRETAGVAILSRWPIGDQISTGLKTSEAQGQGGRVVAGVRVEHPELSFAVVTVHLNSDPAGSGARCEEVRQVTQLVHELTTTGEARLPAIVAGDLNAEPDADEVRLLGGLLTAASVPGLTFADVWRYAVEAPTGSGATWLSSNPFLPWGTTDQRINYVMAGTGFVPLRAGLLGEGADPDDPRWASTHCGVWADIVST